ncbi:MAG: iron-containing alcohol dehydrogenase, partial [Selenomonas sp.]|nr:iron-containing alcohol dehydrogenase [Selenomonas sp.]
MGYTFMVPAKIISGENVISDLGSHIGGKGTKALIVTDEFMVKFGNVAKVEAALKAADIPYVVYAGANTEPTDKIVEGGLEVYRSEKCDFLIALGGGSPIDTAKAIAFMSVAEGKISDYMHVNIDMPVPYLVAIPTTAGTGSEVTKNTIISDTTNNVKMLLGGPSIIPALAVVDPTFTMTAPPSVTANTGLDALCHAIEAYTSRKAQPLTDTFA